jgi:hypothetical protein
MGTYGRNFDFRQSPDPKHRLGRFVNGATAVPQGAPVVWDGADEDTNGRLTFELAAEGATRPATGLGGVALFEVPDNNGLLGNTGNPLITRSSDFGDVPAAVPAQVCHGDETRLAFWNTDEDDFDGMRTGVNVYAARVMVAGASGATPTVEVGEYLVPGAGDDTDGYWKVGGDIDTAWAVVTNVDSEIGHVTAQMLF